MSRTIAEPATPADPASPPPTEPPAQPPRQPPRPSLPAPHGEPPPQRAAPVRAPSPTRWTDPRVATAYARRDESLDRGLLWPLLAEQLSPFDPQRATGRPDAQVVELGSGLGGLSHLLATTKWTRAYAVDLSPAMHRAGVDRYQDDWVERVLPGRKSWRLPLNNQQCTGAVAQFLLLHLRHPAEIVCVLSEARRVLRPGSPLILLEPAAHGRPAGTVQWGGARWGEPAPHAPGRTSARPEEGQGFLAHYRLRGGAVFSADAWHHSPAALADCLRCCGFRVVEITPLAVPEMSSDQPSFHLWRAVAE